MSTSDLTPECRRKTAPGLKSSSVGSPERTHEKPSDRNRKIVYQQPPFSFLISHLHTLLNFLFVQLFTIMPPSTSTPAPAAAQKSFARTATIVATILALLTLLFSFLDSHLDWFYILNPTDLHDLSLRAIGAHGNDTRAVVSYITRELSEKLPGGYINLEEEWIFNNAGGAMGAMYIIHASKSPTFSEC
jgi:hypothetical protein